MGKQEEKTEDIQYNLNGNRRKRKDKRKLK
jgi:hypothetical protein